MRASGISEGPNKLSLQAGDNQPIEASQRGPASAGSLQLLFTEGQIMSKTSHARHEHKKHAKSSAAMGDHIDTSFHEPSVWVDAGIVICLLSLAFFFIVPFASFMSTNLVLIMLALFSIVIVVFMAMVWRNRPSQSSHPRHIEAGHVTYLAAIGLLSIAIVFQVIRHELDVWLVVILVILVLLHAIYRRSGRR